MIRTIGSYLDQRSLQLTKDNQVRRFKARIIDVLFPAHAFAVVAPGYSGPTEVVADPSIVFGSMTRPQVFKHNEVWIEKDDAGRWHATQYLASNRCSPSTTNNAPNVPLPNYQPPIDTNTIDWSQGGGINPVDMSFPPLTIPMGQFSLAKMPPLVGTGNLYDFGDGYNATIAAGTTIQMLYLTTVRRFKINIITVNTGGTDVTLSIFANNGAYADITVYRSVVGDWTITIKNPTTGATISTLTAGIGTTLVTTLTGSNIISVPTTGTVFHSQIAAGATSVSALAYGIGGFLY